MSRGSKLCALLALGTLGAVALAVFKYKEMWEAYIWELSQRREFKLVVVAGCLISIVILIWIIVVRLHEAVARPSSTQGFSKTSRSQQQFVVPRRTEEFETTDKEYTRTSLDALYKSPEYQRMMAAKGPDKKNWNWQTRESILGDEDTDSILCTDGEEHIKQSKHPANPHYS